MPATRYPPLRWVEHRTPTESANVPIFGVELETSLAPRVRSTGRPRRGAFGYEDTVRVAEPEGFWQHHRDGTVSGPEFTSHPASLDHWTAIRPQVEAMLAALRAGGCGSDNAGLHVNINRSAFSGMPHILRMRTLVAANPRFAVRLAGRSNTTMRQWAKMTPSSDYDRYTAVNTQNGDRVEFRLPVGTLDPAQFYATVQWTAALVDYTRDPQHVLTAAAFVDFVNLNASRYPDLRSRLESRFPARFGATPTSDATRTSVPSERTATPVHESEQAPSSALYICGDTSEDMYLCGQERGHAGSHEGYDRGAGRVWGGAFGRRSMTAAEATAIVRDSRRESNRHCSDAICTGNHRTDIIHTPGTLPLRCMTCAHHPAAREDMRTCAATIPGAYGEDDFVVCGFRLNHSIHEIFGENPRFHGFQEAR